MTIIAEIGQNYCGNIGLARILIKEAKENGADLVKFQLFDSMKLYGDDEHPSPNREQAEELFDYGAFCGIEVFFSVFDVERVKWCEEIGVKRYKIASSFRENKKLRNTVEKTGKPILVSWDTYDYMPIPVKNTQFLFCISTYPAIPPLYLGLIYFPHCYQGFSDHTIGIDAAKLALARGAQIIEKHFALDHLIGVDSEWSMTPIELEELKEWEKKVKELL